MFKFLSLLGPFNPTHSFSIAFFTIDSSNGHVLLDSMPPICAYFEGGAKTAKFQICPDTLSQQEALLTCEPPVEKKQLKCTVPGKTCSQGSNGVECVSAGVAFDISTPDYAYTNKYGARIGPAPGISLVQFLIRY
ncbi:uncharacterized protein BKA55DRAFT_585680 [Fusarium redolens]|uniref:Uncharacterized protein n=1 Tax=Fusarium redolens TaxID=48865 RepID=A0A9P9FY19_FUSRE|nr:uncharacterized protein BKA55DRAFT_585680 [Fusarium redolens]KAH7210840.1 hypothetical protein BKA55DRAFT_585680 [Fusarium redolens]